MPNPTVPEKLVSDTQHALVLNVTGDKVFDMHVLEDEPNEEVVALRKRLQSFAENQRTWERTADRLKTASTEIDQLKERVRRLSDISTLVPMSLELPLNLSPSRPTWGLILFSE